MSRTAVIMPEEMESDIFLKHVDKRHAELRVDGYTGDLADHPHKSERWIIAYRGAHDAMHRLYPRMHDHDHVRE